MQQFIDKGWKVVPLGGVLKRLPGGKKTLPSFPKDWNNSSVYRPIPSTPYLGIALAGKASNIIVLDCDNAQTFKMFRALDPDYKFVFESNNKEEGTTGHIVYKYEEGIPNFSVSKDGMKLDVISDGKGVYLPGPLNETKESFTYTEDPKPIPAIVKGLLTSLIPKKQEITNTTQSYDYHFANIIEGLLEGNPSHTLLKALTPKAFRSLPNFVNQGFLHPADVPEGRGSEYLSQVSSILGADISIDVDTYKSAMISLNAMFTDPMDMDRLLRTIIGPMISGEAKGTDGQMIWRYDPNFSKERYNIKTKLGEIIEVFYDPNKRMWYVVEIKTKKVQTFATDSSILSHLSAMSVEPLTKPKLQRNVPLMTTCTLLNKPFGFLGKNEFNLFQSTQYLKILTGDENVVNYKKPEVMLKFLESLIPEKESREYLLLFLRRKLITLEYSPVVLNFVGVSGAGKDLFVNILTKIVGRDYLAKPSGREFIEQYNHYLVDKFIVQCDEYGDQYNRFDHKQQALGRLKTYTGSEEIQIRQMRTDGYIYKHCLTFILTSNKQPLVLDVDDRRLLMLHNPNKLATQDWVKEYGGTAEVVDLLDTELPSFCQYLRDELPMLGRSEYMEPPFTADKQKTIELGMQTIDLIIHFIKNKMYQKLYDLAVSVGVDDIYERHDLNRIYESSLYAIYEHSTKYDTTIRSFRLQINRRGLIKKDTSVNNKKSYYYYCEGLHEWCKENVKLEISDSLKGETIDI